MKLMMAILGFIFFALFFISILRKILIQKSLVNWLFPGGTTKNERLFMITTLLLAFVIFVALALLSR